MVPGVELLATITGHSGAVFSLASAGDNSFYSGSSDKHLAEWNLENFTQEKFTAKLDASVYSICKIKKYDLLLIGLSSGSLHVIDLKERKEIRHLKQHRKALFDIQYSEKKDLIYTCDAEGHFCVWEIPSFRLLLTLPLCNEKIRKISIREDESELAMACGDHHVRVLETNFFNEIHAIESHAMSVNCVYYRSDNVLISGGKDAWLKFYDVRNGYNELNAIPAHNYAIYGIDADPAGRYFATVSRDKTIKLWDSSGDEFLLRIDRKQFDGHSHSVNCILWHKEKNLLITGSDDRTIKIWRID